MNEPSGGPPAHLLVVDDDESIRTLLAAYLERNGFSVAAVANGVAMQAALEEGRVDFLVLDISLPGEDGLSLCRTLRATSRLPVIMLTARGDPVDRILGLEMGADDYLPKPFEPRELLARIRSVLRRAPSAGEVIGEAPHGWRFSGWELQRETRQLLSPDGVVHALSHAEFRMLEAFLEHPRQVLSRDQLLTLARGREAEPFDRSMDLQVSRLRQKLGDDARAPRLIRTIRGAGYVLDVAVERTGP